MAMLPEGIQITGTIDNLCFYQFDGRTIVRVKSSLTRKRVLKDKAFASTRKYAGSFSIACRIGSVIYKAMPGNVKGRWIYRSITGEAASLLYEGKQEQEVKNILWKKYINDNDSENKKTTKAKAVNTISSFASNHRQLRKAFSERWEKQGKPAQLFKQIWRKDASGPSTSPPDLERLLYGSKIWIR